MVQTVKKKVIIVSGYFNPLHVGHLDMISAARQMGDFLIVIVNNDKQQIMKKGKVIIPEADRVRVANSIKGVNLAVLSADNDITVCNTLADIAKNWADYDLVFANGGDRDSSKEVPEEFICKQYNIKMVFDCGGNKKVDSSTRINRELGVG